MPLRTLRRRAPFRLFASVFLASASLARQTMHQQCLGTPRASKRRARSSHRRSSTSRTTSRSAAAAACPPGVFGEDLRSLPPDTLVHVEVRTSLAGETLSLNDRGLKGGA